MSKTVFNLENDGTSDIRLFLEPEGAEFRLAAGKAIEVHLVGNTNPVSITQSVDEKGRICMSIWPDLGEYEIKFEGKDVWECLRKLED